MALSDRIDFDAAGISQDHMNLILKGVAHSEGVYNPDGSLDISDVQKLNGLLRERIARQLVLMVEEAVRYESSLTSVTGGVENA